MFVLVALMSLFAFFKFLIPVIKKIFKTLSKTLALYFV